MRRTVYHKRRWANSTKLAALLAWTTAAGWVADGAAQTQRTQPATGRETATDQAAGVNRPILRSYAVDADKLKLAIEALRRNYVNRPDVRIAGDQSTSRLYFFANRAEQQRIAAWLASWAQSQVEHALHAAANSAEAAEGSVQLVAAAEETAPHDEPSNDVVVAHAAKSVEHTDLLKRLGFDVEIQELPEQDVIVLRGRDVDVEAVAEIIREIERIAQLAEPQIEIVPLLHVRGEAVVTLIESIQQSLLEGRQGRVIARPVGTPNAILLIGWGTAMEAVRGLIGKLDQPVAPDTQMKVYRLQHASAEQVRAIVEQFLQDREGIGPAAKIVSDPRTNTLVVHAAPRDLAETELLINELDVKRGESVSQVRVFALQHSLAADLATTLQTAIDNAQGGTDGAGAILELLTIDGDARQSIRSGLFDNVDVTANEQTNSLVITGPAETMELMAALIERLDQPTATSQIKVFRIVNGDANGLVLMLRAVLPTQAGAGTRPQLAGAEGEASLAPLRFAVEQRTNSIIATGSSGDLRIVEALLLRLDEDETQRRRTTVYRLKNAPALDVAAAINDFLRSEQQVREVAPGEVSPLEQLEREVVVVPEIVSNSLIISATRRFYENIVEIVEDLDAEPPQVVIQVLIAQVALNDTDEFGIELGLQDSVLFDRSLLGELLTTTSTETLSTAQGVVTSTNEVIQSATNTPGFLFNSTDPLPNSASDRAFANAGTVGPQGITNFSVGRMNNELGFGGLVLSASSQSVSVLIRALQESRRLQILSRPQVTTLDNQPAFIQVGQRVPRIVATTLNTFGQTNSIELDNVGLILGVTPRVSPTGVVVMEVDAEKSEVGPDSEGIPVSVSTDGTVIRSPRIDITSAQTTVSAANGETIVLGGLITTRDFDVHRRVPLLADIPLLGDLFRYDLVQTERAELLIILTPHVVLGSTDMERIKQIESSRMNWCAADVHALHGDAGFCGRMDCPICETNVPIIYPDLNPRGTLHQPESIQPLTEDVVPDLLPEGPQFLPKDDVRADQKRDQE